MSTPKRWTREELKHAVLAYKVLEQHANEGTKIHKTNFFKKVAEEMPTRTAKSYEFRMMNISHVYELIGREWVKGYRPAVNVGANVIAEIKSIINEIEAGE